MNYSTDIKPSERGSVIVFSLLLLSVMLAITIALGAIFAPKLRSIALASRSAVAIFAADTAVEMCLYEARVQPLNPVTRPVLTNNATFTIASLSSGGPEDITNDCRVLGNANFNFRAVGSYQDISRAIEINQ